MSANSIQFKPSVFDYSIAEIVKLEEEVKAIKLAEGKDSPNYQELKAKVKAIREVNFPFRTLIAWKRTKSHYRLTSSWASSGDKSVAMKTKESRAKVKAELLALATSSPETESKLHLISQLTFLHGSNSAALAMMTLPDTEPRLRCFGEIVAEGIVPMSGELAVGVNIASNGTNQRNISVETVRGVNRVQSYSSGFSFDPHKLYFLFNHLIPVVETYYSWEKLAAELQTWKKEDREGFDILLGPHSPKLLQLLDALDKSFEEKLRHPFYANDADKIRSQLKLLKEIMQTEQEAENLERSDYQQLKELIVNPYQISEFRKELNWSGLALHIKQLKQWDFSAFQHNVLGTCEQWLQSIEQEKQAQEKPLKMLIAIIEHTFTEEEIAFLKAYRAKDRLESIAMPASLLSIFPSEKEIPSCDPGNVNFSVNAVKREMKYYRTDAYTWESLLSRVLNAKLNPCLEEEEIEIESKLSSIESKALFLTGLELLSLEERLYDTQKELNQLTPIFEDHLLIIEKGYNNIRDALTNPTPPRIQIPTDEEFRLLITKPFPVIFASTVIKPKPSNSHMHPNEYFLTESTSLSPEGCNILFTDTEEAKEKIFRLMPQLKDRVEIHMISELNLPKYEGIDFPLCTAPSQIIS